MQHAAGGAQVVPDQQLGDDAVRREFGQADPHQARKERVDALLDGGDIEHRCLAFGVIGQLAERPQARPTMASDACGGSPAGRRSLSKRR